MIFLDDLSFRAHLYPFTQTRHAADIRVGILTAREKWERLTREKTTPTFAENDIRIPANVIPTAENFEEIMESCLTGNEVSGPDSVRIIKRAWDIFLLNDYALRKDFELLTRGRISATLGDTNKATGSNIFLEEGANVMHSVLNGTTGPIYIGADAVVQEGCCIRGPFSLGEGSVLKMGSMIYGATTIGPHCVAGGEIKNSVMFGYSNKAHHGYLGDSVIGEWCNLGAGTSNSNVKNTGGGVKYFLPDGSAVSAGSKAGLIMGDFSRCAINTSFNTGSIVGVSCNIFGEKMPQKLTPDFSWGSEKYLFEKAINDIDNWKKMKGHGITDEEKNSLKKLYYI